MCFFLWIGWSYTSTIVLRGVDRELLEVLGLYYSIKVRRNDLWIEQTYFPVQTSSGADEHFWSRAVKCFLV